MKRSNLIILVFSFLSYFSYAQDDLMDMLESEEPQTSESVFGTFKTSRLINSYTNETLGKGDLDFRIDHRFEPLSRGYQFLYGFDNISDMRLAFEYGATDNLMVGIGRSKGGFMDAFFKYKLLEQTTDNKIPVGVTLFANSGFYINSTDEESNSFTEMGHRFNYSYQALISRKFNSQLSMILSPTLVHRNYVAANDQNDLFALGFGLRYAFTKSSSVIFDYFHNFDGLRTFGNGTFIPPIGIGYEVETGGHVFQVMLSNAAYVTPNRFITNSTNEFGDNSSLGFDSFRFGFNISRVF